MLKSEFLMDRMTLLKNISVCLCLVISISANAETKNQARETIHQIMSEVGSIRRGRKKR